MQKLWSFHIKVYGYTSIITKGNNFSNCQVTFLGNETFQKGVNSLRKEFAPAGANYLL